MEGPANAQLRFVILHITRSGMTSQAMIRLHFSSTWIKRVSCGSTLMLSKERVVIFRRNLLSSSGVQVDPSRKVRKSCTDCTNTFVFLSLVDQFFDRMITASNCCLHISCLHITSSVSTYLCKLKQFFPCFFFSYYKL